MPLDVKGNFGQPRDLSVTSDYRGPGKHGLPHPLRLRASLTIPPSRRRTENSVNIVRSACPRDQGIAQGPWGDFGMRNRDDDGDAEVAGGL